jgi:hypothetical protein
MSIATLSPALVSVEMQFGRASPAAEGPEKTTKLTQQLPFMAEDPKTKQKSNRAAARGLP